MTTRGQKQRRWDDHENLPNRTILITLKAPLWGWIVATVIAVAICVIYWSLT